MKFAMMEIFLIMTVAVVYVRLKMGINALIIITKGHYVSLSLNRKLLKQLRRPKLLKLLQQLQLLKIFVEMAN